MDNSSGQWWTAVYKSSGQWWTTVYKSRGQWWTTVVDNSSAQWWTVVDRSGQWMPVGVRASPARRRLLPQIKTMAYWNVY